MDFPLDVIEMPRISNYEDIGVFWMLKSGVYKYAARPLSCSTFRVFHKGDAWIPLPKLYWQFQKAILLNVNFVLFKILVHRVYQQIVTFNFFNIFSAFSLKIWNVNSKCEQLSLNLKYTLISSVLILSISVHSLISKPFPL